MKDYSSQAVANTFFDLANKTGRSLTNMQMQKLVYMAHGYCLAILHKPLISNDVRAWQWGPVIPELYEALQQYGNGKVTNPITDVDGAVPENSEEGNLIRKVWSAYQDFAAWRLSALTHQEGTPWSITWGKNKFGVIPADEIKKHYESLIQRAS